ncbi:autotransporter domain-containing protein [Bosea sp. ASV33]|uniref:autotransporter domain-containing protein n=1 Tax=Bosea sp. ASV33 TaxID=2795106 RepID=UPI0018EB8968|nr:autotransporter domain-containing protein [Bosea sp. ASV33]
MIALALPASAATLEFINGETKADPLTLSGSNTLIAGEGVGGTLAGVVSGTGGLSKTGAGTITISGDNTYSGGTDLVAGELRPTHINALGTGVVTFNGGGLGFYGLGTLSIGNDMVFNGTGQMAVQQATILSGALSGAGRLAKNDAGTLTLSGDNTFTGGAIIRGGILRAESQHALGSGAITFAGGSLAIYTPQEMPVANDMVVNAAATIDTAQHARVSGVLSGAASLTKDGGGTLTLAGNNSAFSGGLIIQAGAVHAENSSAFGSGTVTIGGDHGGTLSYADGIAISNNVMVKANTGFHVASGTATQSGRIDQGNGMFFLGKTGAGELVVTSAINAGHQFYVAQGQLTAAAENVLGGRTYVVRSDGTLKLRADQQVEHIAGSGTIDIGSSKLTVGAGAGALNFSGRLIGGEDAHLVKTGGGIQALDGDGLDYYGRISVLGGTLAVNGNFAGTPVLVTNGRLQGSGQLGDVVVDGATLAGTSGTTLSMRDLRLTSSAVIQANLGTTNNGALFHVVGDLVLDGTLNVTNVGGFGPGVYRVFSYGGALDDRGLEIGSAPKGYSAGNLAVQTSVAGQVNLVADNPNYGPVLFWDGDNAANWDNGKIDGGNGRWRTGGRAFTDAAGIQNGAMNPRPGFVVFGGQAGNVEVYTGTGQVQATGMQFATSGYRLYGDMLDIVAGEAIIRVGDGTAASANYTATISNKLDGGGTLTKTDLGTLILDGDNTYWGGTEIRQGTLQLGSGGTSGSIVGDVVNYGVLAFNRSDATTFDGTISGTGAVRIIGGDVTLTAANSYTGGTIVDGGVLRAGAYGAFVDQTAYTVNGGTLDLNDFALSMSSLSGTGGTVAIGASALTVQQDIDTNFAGSLSGTGWFSKGGSGTLTLSGDNSGFTGEGFVGDGTLAVNGVFGGSVDIAPTGRLQGTGTVGDTIVSGTIAPGNSIGTLNIAGNVTFHPGSIYEVEINAAGQGDRIVATGAATISGGTVRVLAGMGDYAPATTYTILTANGATGVNGSFNGVTSNLAFLDPSLSYDANNVYLTMTRNATSFQNVGVTRNQMATGGGVESLRFGNPLYNAVLNLSAPQARTAFDQLSGEIHASAKASMIEDSRFVRNAINDRIRAAFDGVGASGAMVTTYVDGKPVPVAANTNGVALWGQGFGSWGHTDGDGNAARLNRKTGGFFLGLDTPVFDTWRFGAVAGYSNTSFDTKDRHSSGSSDNYHLGLYGGTNWGNIAFRTGAAYTWQDVSTKRSVNVSSFGNNLRGDYNAGTAQIFGELAYRVNMGATRFEPFANLAYVNLHTDGFSERGGAAALTSPSSNTDATFTTLGLRASSSFEVNGASLTAKGALGWRHAFGGVTPISTMRFDGGSAFTVAGVPIARNAAVIEAGLDLALTANAALGVSYGGQFGSGISDQSVKANFNVKF